MLHYRPTDRYGWVSSRGARPLWRRYLWWWLPPLLLFDIWLAFRLWPREKTPEDALPEPTIEVEPHTESAKTARWRMRFPTAQDRLLDPPDPAVFMPTASGNIESALYGSTRTAGQGGRFLPSFHEGIDIAPLRRDRRGAPLDRVYAVGDGRVAYIQRHAGNSNYGIYVVLLHDDPLGELYTLYSHLARVEANLRVGGSVTAGAAIGLLGNTPANIVPMARAHLHFEIGLLQNRRFDRWYRERRRTPDHGNYHGANLSGVDPLAAFAARDAEDRFSMAEFLPTVPVAFELVCAVARVPDYFHRYPALWRDDPFGPGAITLGVCAGGVVLFGRNATAEERDALGISAAHVSFVDEAILGRNGRRLIVSDANGWRLGANGQDWLESLLY